MVVQIGARPDSGFDDPLGMLADCHRRIERFLATLARVAQSDAAAPLTPEQSAAVHSALQYFRTGGRRHNADEEESLFPRLRSVACNLSNAAPASIDRLEHEHREADQLHARVDHLFSAWLDGGLLAAPDRDELRAATAGLQRLYAEHIAWEEKTLFPEAARLLDRDTLTAIGQEFRARRQ